ncbi:MAG: molybdopterin-dependent oxidoreductase, partial [Gracilibacteraceae bacterium]|nr:molybdopterin-dependent oxidoreductase [Gracilibacteraceae bacterium]
MERIWADVKQTICGICSASCPAQVYVRNGEIVRVEASRQPGGSGYLCAKGHAGRGYLYRADRVQTPLRRVGERGEGLFAPITWDEAYREIAERLLPLKAESGPESVAFYSGYSKWYRPLLHRLAHSFGSLNYGTESSSCFQSSMMAHLINAGVYCRPDPQNAELLIVWGGNPFHSTNFSGFALDDLKEKGLEVLYIDPRVTPYSRYADLQLRPRAGTDGALAHFFAQSLIAAGRADLPYIEKYVHGYPPYEAYVRDFSLERAADLTGIAPRDLQAAADMLIRRRRFTIAASQTALTHHANGMQGYRAVMALGAITGNFDREGGMIPLEYSRQSLNHPRLLTEEFIQETRPQNAKAKIGTERFPLWSELIDEFQTMDLGRQILEGTPYPVRAVVAFGLNVRMFPGNRR